MNGISKADKTQQFFHQFAHSYPVQLQKNEGIDFPLTESMNSNDEGMNGSLTEFICKKNLQSNTNEFLHGQRN